MRLPTQIFVATQPISLHLSFDRLAGLVRDVLGGDPRVGQAFLFHNRRATHVKLLWHDGTGYRVLYKRLDRGRFHVPLPIPPGAARVEVSQRELDVLLEGIDTQLLRTARARIKQSAKLMQQTPMTSDNLGHGLRDVRSVSVDAR
jgi:transposase